MTDFIKKHVLSHYGIPLDNVCVSPLGNGHINDTFLVRWPQGEIVLQKLNTHIFTLPHVLINNAVTISEHLTDKFNQGLYCLQVIQPVKSKNGLYFVDLADNGFWRAINYLDNSHTIEVVTSVDEAKMAASAFGHFTAMLSDLDVNKIDDVIVNFLNLPHRIDQLKQAVKADIAGRLIDSQVWVDLVLSQTQLFDELTDAESVLPLRVCHNDTKINNMLFDKRDMSSLAVIDLDTCMKGYLMYDFGDMVRGICSPEDEDSINLDRVIARPDIIEQASKSYIEQLESVISPIEKQSLWLGIKVMALMLGSRFLTDHLNGDIYFGAQRANHNLDRAANQLTIYKSLLVQEAHLKTLFY